MDIVKDECLRRLFHFKEEEKEEEGWTVVEGESVATTNRRRFRSFERPALDLVDKVLHMT